MAKSTRVLYVEDEADIRLVTEIALEDEGFELLLCESGAEALEKAESFAPDLILLDVMMPHMDGPTTLKHLREIPTLKDIPVVFLTAKVQPSEVVYFKSLGAVEVIAKPFDVLHLPSQLHDIIG